MYTRITCQVMLMMTLALGSIAWGVQMPQSINNDRSGPVVKNIMAPNTAARYDAMAKSYRHEAQSNRELAASQKQMAQNPQLASR